MAKRAELPKADAFFGPAPSETPPPEATPLSQPNTEAVVSSDVSESGIDELPQKMATLSSSDDVSRRQSEVSPQERYLVYSL